MTDKHSMGLYDKYRVIRTDGQSEPGKKHAGCEYFVLDLTHDPHALPALKAYADSCCVQYPALAEDLWTKWDQAKKTSAAAIDKQPPARATDEQGRGLCTTNGKPVDQVRAGQTNATGQHDGYIVLCDDERAKGFVRPYRDAYRHVGERPKYQTRELTADEESRYHRFNYVAFEAYPDDAPESNGGACTGRFWTKAQLESGCGTVTTMGRKLSETYARDPKFYGMTFCCGCNTHLPVAEFVWTADGERVGS